MDENRKEEGLSIEKLLLRIIEQKIQEGKNLKEVLLAYFPFLSDEAKMQKICSFLHANTILHLLEKRG